jgi:hypothetical protein
MTKSYTYIYTGKGRTNECTEMHDWHLSISRHMREGERGRGNTPREGMVTYLGLQRFALITQPTGD